jgi:hypothetical protein
MINLDWWLPIIFFLWLFGGGFVLMFTGEGTLNAILGWIWGLGFLALLAVPVYAALAARGGGWILLIGGWLIGLFAGALFFKSPWFALGWMLVGLGIVAFFIYCLKVEKPSGWLGHARKGRRY